jgi:hypothetical protein
MDVYRIEFDSKENQVLWELLFIRTLSEESMVLYPPGKRRASGSSTTSSARVGRILAKICFASIDARDGDQDPRIGTVSDSTTTVEGL